jgi:hypothetical protein
MYLRKQRPLEQCGAFTLMRVRIVRTVARRPALPDGRPKQPWRNVTSRPHSAPRMISLCDLLCFPFEYEGQSNASPLRTNHSAGRRHRSNTPHCAPTIIQAYGRAIDRPSRNEGVKLVLLPPRRIGTASYSHFDNADYSLARRFPTGECASHEFRECRRR